MKKLILSDAKLDRLAEISSEIGQVSLASVVIPGIIGLDRINWLLVALGLIGAIFFWLISLILTKDKEKK